MAIGVSKMIALLLLMQGQTFDSKAKIAFDQVKIDCDFQSIYTRAVKKQQVVVLAVASPLIENVPWKVIPLASIVGEKPGYIVGVPKDGKLIRLDFPPNTPRQRIRLDVLHVYYPLTKGYVECPTCPYGRTFVGN